MSRFLGGRAAPVREATRRLLEQDIMEELPPGTAEQLTFGAVVSLTVKVAQLVTLLQVPVITTQ